MLRTASPVTVTDAARLPPSFSRMYTARHKHINNIIDYGADPWSDHDDRIALQGRAGTGTARPATGLDQPSSAGPRAALPGLGRDLVVPYPVRCNSA